MKEIPLPSDFLEKENREVIVGTTLLTMGSKPPYAITWQSLTSKGEGTVTPSACPRDSLVTFADIFDSFDLNGAYAPGYAGFICIGGKQSQITLVNVPDMKVSTFPLPPGISKCVQSSYGCDNRVGAAIYGTVQRPYLSVGGEIINMTTGQPSSLKDLPPPFDEPLPFPMLTSPHGKYFTMQGNMVSEWDGAAFKPLGTIPNPRVYAIGDDGVVWADQPSGLSHTIIRETPGSDKTETWSVSGSNLFIWPGFLVYTPGDRLDGSPTIFFPELNKILSFPNIFGQPMLSGFQVANNQILISTAGGQVVIEVIPPPS